MGYRVDDTFAFVTDTSADPGTVDLARGVRVLVHEASSSHAASVTASPPSSMVTRLPKTRRVSRETQVWGSYSYAISWLRMRTATPICLLEPGPYFPKACSASTG